MYGNSYTMCEKTIKVKLVFYRISVIYSDFRSIYVII